jgi:putative tricarboxylic transport membrane protein
MTGPGTAANHTEAPPGDSTRRGRIALALRLTTPGAFLVGALALPSFMLDTTRPLRGTGLGPAAWPQVMLALIAFCAAIWLAHEVFAWRRGRPAITVAAANGEPYSYGKAVTGLVMIVAYGILLPVIGFPLATAGFIALWCILGGVRHPLAVTPLSLVGTAALLWMFMGLALMPLSRGQGLFDQVSVTILQLLGIY